MEVETTEREKRQADGTRREVALEQEAQTQRCQFPHFELDIEHEWFITDVVQGGCGVVYRHRATGRPLLIMLYESENDREAGCYGVYCDGAEQSCGQFALCARAHVAVPHCVDEIARAYSAQPPLAAEQYEAVKLNFLASIAMAPLEEGGGGGGGGGEEKQAPVEEGTRRIVKAKRVRAGEA
jgi:hypothetical protein